MDLSHIFNNQELLPLLTYLNILGEAVIKVDEKYCSWESPDHENNQKTERVFAYELYYQFRQLTLTDKYIRVDGEIDKQINNYPINNCGADYEVNQIKFSPDLVVHYGQLNREEENQKLIVEIKTKFPGREELAKTIIKLNHYIIALHFQFAVLVSVNTKFDETIHRIQDIFPRIDNKSQREKYKRIVIFNYIDGHLDATTLYNILY